MKLNIGCGEHYALDWVNVDAYRGAAGAHPQPDLVASATDLPFKDGIATHVFCGHVLEHLRYDDELPVALPEIRRVLTPDGRLMVIGPDIDLTREHEPVLIDGVVHGGQRWPGDEHQWESTGALTLEAVRHAGFNAAPINLADIPDMWPVVDRTAAWQFALVAQPN